MVAAMGWTNGENPMKKNWLWAAAIVLVLDSGAAHAQRRGGRSGFEFAPMNHKVELSALYGYTWLSGYDVFFPTTATTGTFDIESNDNFGVELDVNVRPGGQLVLLYNRMQSAATFETLTLGGNQKTTLGDLDVEYWQIGALSGPFNGQMMPFGGITVGATRFVAGGEDDWKFSFIPQLGAKFYANERIAIRVHARFPITFVQSGFALGFGAGGGYAAVEGTGIYGADLGGGISLLLGS
jgi:hypothetical protein